MQVQGHIALFHGFCHDSFWPVDIDSVTSVFPFADLLVVGEKHTALADCPTWVCSWLSQGQGQGWHSRRQTCRFLGSLRLPPRVKLLERIPANSFRISFFPLCIYPVGRQTESHFESYEQRAMQFIVGG